MTTPYPLSVRPSAARSADLQPLDVACFSVTADNDPAALPRVLEVFAKLGRAPDQCYATSYGANNAELHIDLQYQHMSGAQADKLARALRGTYLVTSVLTAQKQARLTA